MTPDRPEDTLMDTIRNSDLPALSAELAEVGIDEFLSDGFLKDLPIVGSIQKMIKATRTVSDYLFAKKLMRFLVCVAEVSQEERRKQVAKLLVDVEHRQRVGENLMLLLDKLNDIGKPRMVAKAFLAFLREEIRPQQFRRLCHAIELIEMSSIETLRTMYESSSGLANIARRSVEDNVDLEHLAICGLVSFNWASQSELDLSGSTQRLGGFVKNRLGEDFIKFRLS